MAIDPSSVYPAPATEVVALEYPYGRAKNEDPAGSLNGFPFEQDAINDILGFQQAILENAGVAPSGTPEKANASQFLNSLATAFKQRFTQYDSAGGANVFDLTEKDGVPQVSGYKDSMVFEFLAHQTNTGASTAKVGTLPSKPIVLVGDVALIGSEIEAGARAQIQYDGGLDKFVLISFKVSTVDFAPLHIDGMQLQYIDVGVGVSGFTVGAGSCRDQANSQNIIETGGVGKRIDQDWADAGTLATPTGGKVTGEIFAAGDTVYIFEIAKPSGATNAAITKDATGATILADGNITGAGYTKIRRVGKNYMTSATAFYNFIHDLDSGEFLINEIQTPFDGANSAANQALSVPASTPVILNIMASKTGGISSGWIFFGRVGQPFPTPDANNFHVLVGNGNDTGEAQVACWNGTILTNANSEIQVSSATNAAGTAWKVTPIGWIDNRNT